MSEPIHELIHYLQKNYIEVTGMGLSLLYLWYSVKGKALLWVFGTLSSICYLIVFIQGKIYALGTLQIYYIAISIYGLWSWVKKRDVDGGELPINKINIKQWTIYIFISICCFITLYFVIKNFTTSNVPLGDSLATSLLIVGTMLLVSKSIENWLFFIVADTISITIALEQKLYPTVILFITYTIMGIVGYWKWKQLLKKQNV